MWAWLLVLISLYIVALGFLGERDEHRAAELHVRCTCHHTPLIEEN